MIAASLGVRDLDEVDEEMVERIKQAHLLLAKFNAWQPGVFALSGWDLCGVLPLPQDEVQHLIGSGDTRWVHRGAYDLMGYTNDEFRGMPRGRSLYGALPAQLADPTLFASRLREVLDIREASGVSTATQVDVPPVAHRSMLVMVHEIDDDRSRHQVTVLNFGMAEVSGTVRSKALVPGSEIIDLSAGTVVGEVDELNSFSVTLGPHDGVALGVTPPAEDE